MVQLDQAGSGMDRITIVPARGPAAAAIEFFWLHRAPQSGRPQRWRIVPDGSAHLLYHSPRPALGASGRLCIVGARSTFTDADLSWRSFSLGARLRPGALRALTRIPAPELCDVAVPFRSLEPDSAAMLADRLRAAGDPVQALRTFCDAVGERVRAYRPDPFDVRATHVLGRRAANVREASAALDASPRWLRERFRRSTGLSPKRFMRVNRLFRALGLAVQANDPAWARIAALCGYFDQSHLIHEFGELLGETPERFLARREH